MFSWLNILDDARSSSAARPQAARDLPGRSRRHPGAFLFFGLSLGSAPAWAGPPFVTDDPEPVEARAWEINTALTGQRAKDGTAALLPVIDINYGLVSGLQLHLQPQAAFARTNAVAANTAGTQHNDPEVDLKDRLPQPGESGSSSNTAYGLGDTEVGIKWRLTPESESGDDWMISVYPLAEIPTGNANRNLGAGASSFYLPIWFQRSFGKLTTFGGGGYWINRGAGSRNAWAGGWAALYAFDDALQLGGEVFAKTADAIGQSGLVGFNLGGSYALDKEYAMLFSVGRGLGGTTPNDLVSAYVGLRISF